MRPATGQQLYRSSFISLVFYVIVCHSMFFMPFVTTFWPHGAFHISTFFFSKCKPASLSFGSNLVYRVILGPDFSCDNISSIWPQVFLVMALGSLARQPAEVTLEPDLGYLCNQNVQIDNVVQHKMNRGFHFWHSFRDLEWSWSRDLKIPFSLASCDPWYTSDFRFSPL